MKSTIVEVPPESVPRLNSLLHRLQHATQPEDQPYLDQLMIFLDDPPDGTRDRWKEGAEMCVAWGIPCTGASVWRLYRTQVFEWRLRMAREAAAENETIESLDERAAELVALRMVEVLANPQTPPACLVAMARMQFRKNVFEFGLFKEGEELRRRKEAGARIAKNFEHIFNRPSASPTSTPP